MTNILDLPDDVWFLTFYFLTPLDFTSIPSTCLHFCHLTKCSAANKYWEYQCQRLWAYIKENNYSTQNFREVFRLIIDFTLTILTGNSYDSFKKMHDSETFAEIESHVDYDDTNKDKDKLFKKLRKQGYNMKISVDTIGALSYRHILSLIIELDNVEIFKIYTCNMIDTINDPIQGFPAGSSSQTILMNVVRNGAKKVARYLLAPVKTDSDDNDDDDKHKYKYNFDNIDVTSAAKGSAHDTPLTYAAYCKHVEIVSLLINHKNMTQNGMNKGDKNEVKPLHCACTYSMNRQATEEEALDICQMLINDKRTNINGVDKDGETALMFAIQSQTKSALYLMQHDKIDINIQKNNGDTVLHVLTTMGTSYVYSSLQTRSTRQELAVKLAKQLMKRKDLNANLLNNDGYTPADLAAAAGFEKMTQLLTQYMNNKKSDSNNSQCVSGVESN